MDFGPGTHKIPTTNHQKLPFKQDHFTVSSTDTHSCKARCPFQDCMWFEIRTHNILSNLRSMYHSMLRVIYPLLEQHRTPNFNFTRISNQPSRKNTNARAERLIDGRAILLIELEVETDENKNSILSLQSYKSCSSIFIDESWHDKPDFPQFEAKGLPCRIHGTQDSFPLHLP